MRSGLAAGLGLVALVVSPLAGQRRTPPAPTVTRPLADAAVPFKIGETLTYDVSWSMFIVAGSAVTTVKEKRAGGGANAYQIVAEGRPISLVAKLYPLYYRMDTALDSSRLLSQRGTLTSEERGERRTATTTFERALNRVSFELKTDKVETAQYAAPPNVEDGLAALYVLRARGVKTGERFSIPIADSGTLFNAEFIVGGLEEVNVPYGSTSAWNVRVTLTDLNRQPVWKNIVVWMSNDARRLPLKMQAELPVGHFVLALKTVQ